MSNKQLSRQCASESIVTSHKEEAGQRELKKRHSPGRQCASESIVTSHKEEAGQRELKKRHLPGRSRRVTVSNNQKVFSSLRSISNISPTIKFRPCHRHQTATQLVLVYWVLPLLPSLVCQVRVIAGDSDPVTDTKHPQS